MHITGEVKVIRLQIRLQKKQQVRATRSEGQCRLHQPVPNSQTLSRGCRYAAPSICNLLPPDLRIKETITAFKTGLKHNISSCQPMDRLSSAS